MTMRAVVLALALCSAAADQNAAQANPIRKVVTMLQAMEKKVTAEGAKEQELFDKYMCYCKNSGGDLAKSIGDAGTKVPQLGADIKEGEAKLVQLKEDLKQHQVDRSAAKQAVADATTLREKEAGEYAKEANEASANIAALNKAVTALTNGMAGGFLQTAGASRLLKVVAAQDIDEEDRKTLQAFLQGSTEYAPSSGQITGILKTMGDEMTKSFNEAKAAEDAAIAAFNSLVAAKTKEINALTAALETKMTRSGELAVEIVQMKNDLGDTEAALIQDQAFLKDMEANCAKKQAEWSTIVETRNQELSALADTIKVLNDDDALELFKKALPGASAAFVQLSVNTISARANALAAIRKAGKSPQLDFIAMAIQGKKIGFDKVIKMIDEMAATLKKEQLDDDHKKEYCAAQFDMADDKKKGLERAVSDLDTAIEDAKEGITTKKAEIEALGTSIKKLDKSVAEATEQRKEENEDYTELMASDSAAKEILGFAKNRLNKFYNPKLYKAPAAPAAEAVFAAVSEHGVAKPAPPPEAPGAYKKKSGESGGVIAMIDLLVKDLDKEMTVAKAEETDAQGDYEGMMKDSAAKRADDSKTLADSQGTLADLESSLQSSTENKGSTNKELGATVQYISSLHAECDWLIQYFEIRKEARTSEIDALGKAKAVLSGADFSLVQTKTQRFLQ